MLPDGKAWLVVKMGGGNAAEAEAKARGLMAQLADWTAAPHARVIGDPAQQSEVWELRESALGATARLPDGQLAWTGWDDSAVAPENLGRYLRALLKLYEHYGYQASIYGHFGEGCIHHRLNLDLTSAPGIATYRSFAYQAAELVVAMGGSISGEHGDGQSRAELLPRHVRSRDDGRIRPVQGPLRSCRRHEHWKGRPGWSYRRPPAARRQLPTSDPGNG
jgi:FAD/FMN-containing dehydrogenase